MTRPKSQIDCNQQIPLKKGATEENFSEIRQNKEFEEAKSLDEIFPEAKVIINGNIKLTEIETGQTMFNNGDGIQAGRSFSISLNPLEGTSGTVNMVGYSYR